MQAAHKEDAASVASATSASADGLGSGGSSQLDSEFEDFDRLVDQEKTYEEKLEAVHKAKGSLESKARVALEQGHDELDACGNLCSDSFTSAMDEVTGLLTLFLVYDTEEYRNLYVASLTVYLANVLFRFVISLYATCFQPGGVQLKRKDRESQHVSLWTYFRLILGILVILVEPVSGIRLINSVFEAATALTEEERRRLIDARVAAKKSEIDAIAKKSQAERIAKFTETWIEDMAKKVGFTPHQVRSEWLQEEKDFLDQIEDTSGYLKYAEQRLEKRRNEIKKKETEIKKLQASGAAQEVIAKEIAAVQQLEIAVAGLEQQLSTGFSDIGTSKALPNDADGGLQTLIADYTKKIINEEYANKKDAYRAKKALIYNPDKPNEAARMIKRVVKLMLEENQLIGAEEILARLQASNLTKRANEAFFAAALKEEQSRLRRDIKRLRMNEMVEIMMALFADFPELVIGIAFIALGGLSAAIGSSTNDTLAVTSDAEVSLFITSEIVSLFHAVKCIWSWYKNRKLIRRAKVFGHDNLNTYDGYFAIPTALSKEEVAGVRDHDWESEQKQLNPAIDTLQKVRHKWEQRFGKVLEDAQRSKDQEVLAYLSKRKKWTETEDAKEKKAVERRKSIAIAEAEADINDMLAQKNNAERRTKIAKLRAARELRTQAAMVELDDALAIIDNLPE